jgi:hypothetical protein
MGNPTKKISSNERWKMVQDCANSLTSQLTAHEGNHEAKWEVAEYQHRSSPSIDITITNYGDWYDVDYGDADNDSNEAFLTHIAEHTQDFINSVTEALSKQYPMALASWGESEGNVLKFEVAYHPNLDPSYRWWRHESIHNNT